MNVEATDLEVSLFPAAANVQSNASYIEPQEGQLAQVVVADNLPDDPARMLAVMARTVAYDVARTRCPEIWGTDAIEYFVELIPTFFGFGVFMANTTLRESNYSDALMIQWSVSRSGHLSAEVHGYLLALFAWVRDEQGPSWAQALRLDAKETMRAGLRYLYKTNDAVFERNLLGISSADRGSQDLRIQLCSKSDTQKFSALIDAHNDLDKIKRNESEIRVLLKSRQHRLRVLALQSLGNLPSLTSQTLEAVINTVSDSDITVRRCAVDCLRPGSSDDGLIIHVLSELLLDPSAGVTAAAATSLERFPDLPKSLRQNALAILKRSLAAQNEHTVHAALRLLLALVEDWDELIEELGDPSWQCEVRDHLQHMTSDDPNTISPTERRSLNVGESRIL
jgi:hypothetical protein